MKKTWQQKLEDKASLPKVFKLEKGFPMTAANAVEETSKEGKPLDIPYWRTLKAGGFLIEHNRLGWEHPARRSGLRRDGRPPGDTDGTA